MEPLPCANCLHHYALNPFSTNLETCVFKAGTTCNYCSHGTDKRCYEVPESFLDQAGHLQRLVALAQSGNILEERRDRIKWKIRLRGFYFKLRLDQYIRKQGGETEEGERMTEKQLQTIIQKLTEDNCLLRWTLTQAIEGLKKAQGDLTVATKDQTPASHVVRGISARSPRAPRTRVVKLRISKKRPSAFRRIITAPWRLLNELAAAVSP